METQSDLLMLQRPRRLGQCAVQPRQELVDLALGDDQRRAEGQRVADGAEIRPCFSPIAAASHRLASRGNGALPQRSRASSTPASRPLPRTSPTIACLRPSACSPPRKRRLQPPHACRGCPAPGDAQRLARDRRRHRMARVGHGQAEHAEPLALGQHRLPDARRDHQRGDRNVGRRQRLGADQQIRLQPHRGRAEHVADPAEGRSPPRRRRAGCRSAPAASAAPSK